jgi:hypothetical protein
MKKWIIALVLGPLFPLPAAALSAVTTSNAYMVENTSGTTPSGQVCYDFQTRPGCSAFIAGISSGSISSGSTNYIQNSATPTTATQVFSVSSGTITAATVSTITINTAIVQSGTPGTSGQLLSSNGNISPPTWTSFAISSGAIPPGSTQYIQNSASPTIATQVFSVSTATIANPVALKGVTNGTNAAAGNLGEYIESIFGPQNVPTTAQIGDMTNISLTAGDWDITGIVEIGANGSTVTGVTVAGITTTPGNSTLGRVIGSNWDNGSVPATSATDAFVVIPSYRFSVAVSTTVYFKCQTTYTVAFPQAQGRLSARRVH